MAEVAALGDPERMAFMSCYMYIYRIPVGTQNILNCHDF